MRTDSGETRCDERVITVLSKKDFQKIKFHINQKNVFKMIRLKKMGLLALLLAFLFVAFDADVMAQKSKKKKPKKAKKEKIEEVMEMPKEEKPWATKENKNGCLMYGEDSVKAVQSISLYRSVFKNGDYQSCLNDWTYVYENAPGLREQTFKDGEQIYKKFFEDATDPTEKKKNFDKLMEIYDQRAICWGKSAFLTGKKGLAYAKYYPEEKAKIQDFLSKAIDNGGNETSYTVLKPYFQMMAKKYAAKEIKGEEIQEIYDKIISIAQHNVENNEKKKDKFQKVIDDIQPIYSKIADKEEKDGVSDCASAKEYYGVKYAENPNDPVVLAKYYRALTKFRCTADPVFLDVAIKFNEMEPSAGKCKFIARSYKKSEDYVNAEMFYNKAIELETNNAKKAEIKMEVTNMYAYNKKDKSTALKMAREVAELRPDWGAPWILIGNIYAGRARNCEGFDARMAVCVAMDMWGKAKRVDPASANKAQESMNKYYGSLPEKKELFQRGLSVGSSYTVPCLGVTTTVRHK